MNCYSPNFQGFILMKNALNNQVGMLGDRFLWLVADLKQGVIYFIKQALPPNISAGSVSITVCKKPVKRKFRPIIKYIAHASCFAIGWNSYRRSKFPSRWLFSIFYKQIISYFHVNTCMDGMLPFLSDKTIRDKTLLTFHITHSILR